MDEGDKMNSKRWIAIGLSVAVFVSSLIISAAGSWIAKDTNDEAISIWEELLAEEVLETVLEEGDALKRIVVVDVSGTIMDSSASYFAPLEYDHNKILDDLNRIKEDDTIKAILLKVNSPGGGVYESSELNRRIYEVAEAKDLPVYVSMESMAASGGYYISAKADKIYAAADTITGSIGVIMSGVNYSELMDNYGVSDVTVKSGDLKDMGSSTRPTTEEDLKVMQGLVDSMYERFVDVVEEGRGMDRSKVYEIADGRVYDGYQALEIGLIDELGYYDEALEAL
jgi:protease-4